MECLKAIMKKSNISFDEFVELHRGKSKPILLIDTLDMLTYGLRKEKMESVASAWVDLIHRLDKERIHALWTVRPVEFKLPWKDLMNFHSTSSTSELAIPIREQR